MIARFNVAPVAFSDWCITGAKRYFRTSRNEPLHQCTGWVTLPSVPPSRMLTGARCIIPFSELVQMENQ